jgi:hypothetical protein
VQVQFVRSINIDRPNAKAGGNSWLGCTNNWTTPVLVTCRRTYVHSRQVGTLRRCLIFLENTITVCFYQTLFAFLQKLELGFK